MKKKSGAAGSATLLCNFLIFLSRFYTSYFAYSSAVLRHCYPWHFSLFELKSYNIFNLLHSLSITSLFSLSLVCEPEVSGQPGSEKKRRQTGGRTGPSQCSLLLQSSSLGGEEKVLLTALVPSNVLSFYNHHLWEGRRRFYWQHLSPPTSCSSTVKCTSFTSGRKKNTRQHCSKKCSKTRKARGLNRWPFSNNLW